MIRKTEPWMVWSGSFIYLIAMHNSELVPTLHVWETEPLNLTLLA